MADWNPKANDLFLRAAEISAPAERQAFLDEQCAGDADLRQQVESLLADSARVGSFLNDPAVARPAVTVGYAPLTEGPGTVIGPYKLLQQIGEGGFGVVYMAEQQYPVRRMVALKIIKPGMDTAQVIARFESERQALALMDHPNIARVLDAGATDSGRPYFVMELVKGVPITEFCDRNHFPPEARLKLFLSVCHAIQHAHHKGVIHRDVKPSNVMVTLHDGVPVVKVIDFGVAKATGQKLTERTLFTQYGQMIGTPAYMSPEQAEMSGLDIDTRSDIYALGVLLYELLTGTTPLESKRLREAGYAEMQRLIREEEPPRPSNRLSSLGGSATVLAGNRGLDVKELVQLLASDLDWVVMKALEKDRNRRYGTPGSFAEDLERYLRHEAILARPPSPAYKFKKFAQRNRVAVLTTAVVAATLLVGTTVATWQAQRAMRAEAEALAALKAEADARHRAEASEQRAVEAAGAEKQARQAAQTREAETEAVLRFVEDKIFAAARPEGQDGGLGHDVTLRRALEAALPLVEKPSANQHEFRITDIHELKALPVVEKAFANQPLIEARLRETLGVSFFFLGELRTAVQQLEAARALYARHRGPDHPDTLLCTSDLALSYVVLGRYADALKLREETLALARAKFGPENEFTLLATINLAGSYMAVGRFTEALELSEAMRPRLAARFGPDNVITLINLRSLAACYTYLDRARDALEVCDKTLPLFKEKLGKDHPETLQCMLVQGFIYSALERYADALKIHEETLALRKVKLGPDHPDTLASVVNVAVVYVSLDRAAEAFKLCEDTLPVMKARLGADHPTTLTGRYVLGLSCTALGRYTEALEVHEETLALRKAKLGPEHLETLTSQIVVASNLVYLDRGAEALKLCEESLPVLKARFGPNHELVLQGMRVLFLSYVAVGRYADALECAGKIRTRLGSDHPEVLGGIDFLASIHDALDRHADALALYQEALTLRRGKLGPDHPDTLGSMWGVANSLVKLERGVEAMPILDECVRRAAGKEVDPTMVPNLMDLRLRHFEKAKDAAGCRQTAELWEKLKRADAESLYNAARMRAVTAAVLQTTPGTDATRLANEQADRAMAWLKQAVAAGYKDVGHLKEDRDLDALRDREDFKKLVAESRPD